MLADSQIRRLVRAHDLVNPFHPENIQPASLEVTLGGAGVLDFEEKKHKLPYTLEPFKPLVLGSTEEYLSIPNDIGAQFNGKSSLARQGIMVHVSAGFIDPGFYGQLTLEIVNLGGKPFQLTHGMKIGQIHFFDMIGRVQQPYGFAGNHYMGQIGPTPAHSLSD